MSLECGECERDLRGGHDPSCSRHPVNKKGHPMHKLVKALRKALGDRDDHHALCSARRAGGFDRREKCDCYAKEREAGHVALDQIIDYLYDCDDE